MLMTTEQIEKNFQAKIPIGVWNLWEKWTAGRPRMLNPQILTGFIRLFLAMPLEIQMKALTGTDEELLTELSRRGFSASQHDTRAHDAEEIAAAAESLHGRSQGSPQGRSRKGAAG